MNKDMIETLEFIDELRKRGAGKIVIPSKDGPLEVEFSGPPMPEIKAPTAADIEQEQVNLENWSAA